MEPVKLNVNLSLTPYEYGVFMTLLYGGTITNCEALGTLRQKVAESNLATVTALQASTSQR
jgi:hypothetical protein